MNTLTVYVGPVHSGKSSRALDHARRLVRQGWDLVAVRPAKSRRSHELEGMLVTKNKQRWPVYELETVEDVYDLGVEASVLWIDEPMLFEASCQEQLPQIVSTLRRNHVRVLVSGLSATSELKRFGTVMAELMAVADEIVHCKADCDECERLNVATRSYFRGGLKRDDVAVGGEESYQALCPDCWTARLQVSCA